MEPSLPTTARSCRPFEPRTRRVRVAALAVGAVLMLGGCGAAEIAEQQVQQAADAVGQSARAQAENMLEEALGALPGTLQVSQENRAAFTELRTGLEQVNSEVLSLLSAPQDLSEAALAPLQEQLAALQSSVQERAASLTGISVAEQQAWAELAESVQATADQVGLLAGLLG